MSSFGKTLLHAFSANFGGQWGFQVLRLLVADGERQPGPSTHDLPTIWHIVGLFALLFFSFLSNE